MSKEAKMEALKSLDKAPKDVIVDKTVNVQSTSVKTVWFDIDKKLLGYEGRFYSDKYQFQVLPISTDTIKAYSSMDENNELSVLNGINHVITNHMRVLEGTKQIPIDEVLYEHDRFPALLLINRYTGGTNNVSAEITCENNHVNTEIVRPEILNYETITDKANSLYDAKENIFVLKTKSSGVLKYKPLTNKDSNDIMEWITSKTREGDEIELTFSVLAGFFMHNNKDIESAYMDYLSESGDQLKLSIMLDFCQNQAPIRQAQSLNVKCKTCHRLENRISDLKGIKTLFFIQDIDSEY